MCGIAEYSRFLFEALRDRNHHEVSVLCNYPIRVPDWAPAAQGETPFFSTGWHLQAGTFLPVNLGAALDVIDREGLELLHIQYQNWLYGPDMQKALPVLGRHRPLVATFHDPCIPPDFPWSALSGCIFHNDLMRGQVVGSHRPIAEVIPMGIPVVPDRDRHAARAQLGLNSAHVVASVGFGRTDYNRVLDALKPLTARFPDLLYLVVIMPEIAGQVHAAAAAHGMAGHVRVVEGYLPKDQLFLHMQAADLLVCYYPPGAIEGVTSSAARLAIGARRPLVVSDVGFMRDLPAELKVPFGDAHSLRARVERILEDPSYTSALLALQDRLLATDSWPVVVERHEGFYRKILG